jgi:hypothetical protein
MPGGERFRGKLMLTCEELTRWVASGELEEAKPTVRWRVWVHLLVCRHCRRYATQIRAIGAAARRSLGEPPESSSDIARLEARILQRCLDEAEMHKANGGRQDPNSGQDEPGRA